MRKESNKKYIIRLEQPTSIGGKGTWFMRIYAPKFKSINFAQTKSGMVNKMHGLIKAIKNDNFTVIADNKSSTKGKYNDD